MIPRITGDKKAFGLALKECKDAGWFKQLDKDDQEYVIATTKELHTAPDKNENAALNLFLGAGWDRWVGRAMQVYPHYDGGKVGGVEIRMLKREYVSDMLRGL